MTSEKLHEYLFFYMLYGSYLLFVLILLGISINAPDYLETLNFMLKMFICLFLLIRFNPLTENRMNSFDKRVVFSASLFLLSTTTISEIVIHYDKLKNYLTI